MTSGQLHFQSDYRARFTPPGSHQLAFFVVASVALHCLILALPGSPPTPGHDQAFATNHLDVYLTNEQQEYPPTRPRELRHRANIPRVTAISKTRKRHARPAKKISPAQATPRTQRWFHSANDKVAPPTTSHVATGQTATPPPLASKPTAPDPSAVALLLRQALVKHFRYPPIARQNAWQGKVVLSVLVEADGRVGHARVLRPSHYAILDRAARRAANAIGRIPAARPLLAGQSLSFRVPVAYRLEQQ